MCSFEDTVGLDLIDLDPNPGNQLVLDNISTNVVQRYPCPHNIVLSVANIVKKKIENGLSTNGDDVRDI